jgi:molybdopterin-containing oxidoreductase family iron-sulfur binding subunit
LPVLVQPGQHPRTVAVGLGYGRTQAGPVGNGVGANAFGLGAVSQGRVVLAGRGRLAAAPGKTALPLAQVEQGEHHREHVKEAELVAFLANPAAGNEDGHEVQPNLWEAHPYKGHRWGMAIDLTACTGCSACLISCQAENNVAVVGADEVRRRREMHWIRIDRYYAGSPEDPQVVHQPMMCQHCENAPCETVCPVLATMHSSEGLNQQIYNRCVGTRYCANNCPPKVRRFNWWEYPHDDPLERMVLNPDVAVRSRGVMEKCSLCVQRIQEGKVRAKGEGRELQDGDIRTACEQSCPTRAITFGDLNDPKGALAKRVADERSYRVLAEVNIGPSIHYLTRIRNSGGRSGSHE